ncbi:MAG: aldehyde dehydrogenase family protein [Acidobacteriaceae bacterium]|nr:aldehyde dehydrogenase family protein [Acidobacteriaceae bacterium]MBV9297277.1 aldehyde dehydrogenase family protein [Acidobacteriaceae bacterium]MBV9765631.1 aldehyde dehydrogenase family protein [Acidobacteriaceae bacterium]
MGTASLPLETTSAAKYGLYIGGEWLETNQHDVVRLPYDGSIVGVVSRAADKHLETAIEAAREGAKAMAALPNFGRAELLLHIAQGIKDDEEELAKLICSESGKPIKEARTEARRAVDTLTAAAHAARELHGEVVPMDFAASGQGRMAMTVREPLGVIGAITPFNFPLNLTLHKLAPALAAGNAVVHKPAERTPLSALRLAQLVSEAGAPRGAYNVITGDGPSLAGEMLRHPGIAMITFTGSLAVGKQLREKAGLKRLTLELGSNSAVIVESDADLGTAISRSVQGAFSHSGQVCISLQRAFVHESVMQTYLDGVVASTKQLRMGHPYDDSTDISSLIDEKAAVRVESWIQEAVHAGARLLCGGKRKGSIMEPAVLVDVPASARISCEEVFGPVLAVYPYRSLDEAIRQVNSTPYGLQAGVFTQDLPRAFSVARKLQFGGVLINDVPAFRADHMPYGGAKHSGLGREGPRYAIEEMTELKLICWKV